MQLYHINNIVVLLLKTKNIQWCNLCEMIIIWAELCHRMREKIFSDKYWKMQDKDIINKYEHLIVIHELFVFVSYICKNCVA